MIKMMIMIINKRRSKGIKPKKEEKSKENKLKKRKEDQIFFQELNNN